VISHDSTATGIIDRGTVGHDRIHHGTFAYGGVCGVYHATAYRDTISVMDPLLR
jgi:hypothetical protein